MAGQKPPYRPGQGPKKRPSPIIDLDAGEAHDVTRPPATNTGAATSPASNAVPTSEAAPPPSSIPIPDAPSAGDVTPLASTSGKRPEPMVAEGSTYGSDVAPAGATVRPEPATSVDRSGSPPPRPSETLRPSPSAAERVRDEPLRASVAPRRGASLPALLGAAISGAALALLGGWLLLRAGLGLPGDGGDTRIAQLEQRIAELSAPANRSDLAAITTRLGEIDGRIAAADAKAGAFDSAALAALGERVTTIETATPPLRTDLDALAASVGDVAGRPVFDPAALAGAVDRTAKAEEAIAALRADLDTRLTPVTQTMATLSDQVTLLRNNNGDTPPVVLKPMIDEAAARLNEFAGRLATVEARKPADLAPLNEAVKQLQTQTATLVGGLDQAATDADLATVRTVVDANAAAVAKAATGEDVTKLAGNVDALGGRLSGLETRVVDATAILPAVAAQSLASAVQAGQPFAIELKAIRASGVDDPAVAALEPFAAAGLPDADALRADWTRLEPGIVSDKAQLSEEQGAFSRLLSSARSRVQVRPVGAVEGPEPAAIASRIDAALAAGDLPKALAEWDTLPEGARAATVDWGAKLRARVAAARLTERLRDQALGSVGGAADAPAAEKSGS